MLRVIFKNLWNRRSRYAWLFMELVLVTVIAWQLIDRSVVLIYDRSLPMGYDIDRLVKIDVSTLPEKNADFKPEYDTEEGRINSIHAFLGKVRAFDGVEAAMASGAYAYMGSPQLNTYYTYDGSTDTVMVSGQFFWTGTDFFRTIGLEPADGTPAEVLDNVAPGEVILTETLARQFSPDGGVPTAKLFNPNTGEGVRAVGVVKDVRRSPLRRSYSLAFVALAPVPYDNFACTARLKDGVDMKTFIDEFRSRASRELTAGNYAVKAVTPYTELFAGMAREGGITNSYRRGMALTVFFMLNLLLGVVGSFYLQTRRRTGEIGVHRAFGATRGKIRTILLGESFVLMTVAFIVGIFLYLQYGLAAGLDFGYEEPGDTTVADTWVSSFGIHFAAISAIVYVVMLVCVAVGTYFPAREASRVNPIDALRNE